MKKKWNSHWITWQIVEKLKQCQTPIEYYGKFKKWSLGNEIKVTKINPPVLTGFARKVLYSMGVFIFFNFSSICYIIYWKFHIFFIFHQFSMLFNGKFTFYQFPMLFNGNLRLEKLGEDVMSRVCNGSPLCPTGHRPFGAAAQKGDQPTNRPTDRRTDIAGCRVS